MYIYIYKVFIYLFTDLCVCVCVCLSVCMPWYTRATSFKSCACCMYLRMDHCARVQCQSSCPELRAQPCSRALHFFDPRPNTDIGTCRSGVSAPRMRQNGLHKANPSTPAAGQREPARRHSRLRPAPQPAGGSNAKRMGVVSCSPRSPPPMTKRSRGLSRAK